MKLGLSGWIGAGSISLMVAVETRVSILTLMNKEEFIDELTENMKKYMKPEERKARSAHKPKSTTESSTAPAEEESLK